jgi:CRISPR-associated Csx10 family RAMP protein
MKRYHLTATLRSPLVARRERQSQRSEGVTSLSGTLVRGALAQLYLGQRGRADELFRRLFLDEEVCRYGPLDPADQVFPLSAASCKRESGFVADGRHGLVDLLWLRVASRLCQDLPEPLLQRGMRCRFPGCGEDLKAKEGYWSHDGGRNTEPKKQWRRGADTHVGIDRLAHSAQESILYTLPVLEPRHQAASLTGLLEAGAEEAEHLRRLLAGEEGEVRIGHARTRGYGRVQLSIQEAEPARGQDPEAWSRGLIDFLRTASRGMQALDPNRHFFFSLGLPTGALLLDSVLRYTLDPSGMVPWLPALPPPDASHSVLEGAPTPFEIGRLWSLGAITRHERLRGWNTAHGLPRQDEWVVTRGAGYAYLYEGDGAGRRALQEKLAGLIENGLGARRGEGLGRVVVSDEFHHLYHQQEGRP